MRFFVSISCVWLSIVATASAADLDCEQWARLGSEGREATIDDMIEARVSGGAGSTYAEQHPAVMRRCLDEKSAAIRDAIDDACGAAATANLNAISKVFASYYYSCIP